MAFTFVFADFPHLVLHHDVEAIGNVCVDRFLEGGALVTEDEEVYWADQELSWALARGWGSWYVDVKYFNKAYAVYIVFETECSSFSRGGLWRS